MLQTYLDLHNVIFQEIYSNQIKVPILFLVSENDQICRPEFALKYFKKVVSKRKEIVVLKNRVHDMLYDEEYPEMLNTIDKWLLKCSNNPPCFSFPESIKIDYSCFNWKYYIKVVFFMVVIGYLLKKRRGVLRIVSQLFRLKKNS